MAYSCSCIKIRSLYDMILYADSVSQIDPKHQILEDENRGNVIIIQRNPFVQTGTFVAVEFSRVASLHSGTCYILCEIMKRHDVALECYVPKLPFRFASSISLGL